MLHKTTQLSVMAVAVLAIVAVVAVALFAAGGARAENVTTNALPYESDNGGSNAVQPQRDRRTPTPTPTPPMPRTPETCTDPPKEVFSEDHLALFDVYWDGENLVNNPCPPFADHGDDGTIRTRSDFNVLNGTVVHIPHRDRFKIVSKVPKGGIPSEYFVVAANSPLLRSYQGQSGDKIAWIVAEWPDDVPNRTTGDPDFHFGFSAGLLHPENWVASTGNPGDVAMIQYEFEAEREPEVAPGDRGAVFASSGATFTRDDIKWDSHNPDTNEMEVAVGEYEHLYWAFTKPGTYVFWAHAKGYPKSHENGGALLPAGSKVEGVTSEVVRYTFHVGLMADLNVRVTSVEAANAGEDVTLTVTARNNGPDDAPNTDVAVELPEGLTHESASAATGSYNGDTGEWNVGALGNGASATLTVNATVDADVPLDVPMAVEASIMDARFGSYRTRSDTDPRESNNVSVTTVTPPSNHNPLLNVRLAVDENSAAGTMVTDALLARDDNGDPLAWSIVGAGAERFAVDASGQITVAPGANLDYECQPAYRLLLQVSDGRDLASNPDPAIDDSIGLLVGVNDLPDDPTLALAADRPNPAVGETVTLTATASGDPGCGPATVVSYTWAEHDVAGTGTWTSAIHHSPTWESTHTTPGRRDYRATAIYTDALGNRVVLRSELFSVTWVGP